MCPYASSNDCCIVHSTSARADPELVGGSGGGWSCMLLLHPAPTCADAGPDLCTLTFAPCTLTFAPCACCGCHRQQLTVVVFLPQPLAQIPHLHTWWFHPLLLALVVFILSPTGADTGGFTHCYLRWWCLSFHPLAQILYLHSSYLHCVVVVF